MAGIRQISVPVHVNQGIPQCFQIVDRKEGCNETGQILDDPFIHEISLQPSFEQVKPRLQAFFFSGHDHVQVIIHNLECQDGDSLRLPGAERHEIHGKAEIFLIFKKYFHLPAGGA